MDPLALNAQALQEPWRLWTAHVAPLGWEKAPSHLLALWIPLFLACRRDRARWILSLLLLPPLLSLLLMPGLGGEEYRGASGLACGLWALVGLRLVQRRESAAIGVLMLGGLGLKLAMEATFATSFLGAGEGWQTLPEAHLWGALLGLGAALPGLRRAQVPRPQHSQGA